MIEVVGLRKSFGNVCALNDITFQVNKGQIVGFLGANGAGKTTTMDILCGCIGADAGSAKIAGFEISSQPIEAKKRMGYLPDEPPLHKEMKVEEYLAYVGRLHGLSGKDLRQRVDDIMDRLELSDMRSRLIGNLSKGYKQRVGLAQALVHDPEVLILDEPTEGLDPNQILQIRQLIRSLKGQHTILFSSHILSEVESICDELVIIDKGRIVESGSHRYLVARLESGRQYQLRVRQGAHALVERLRVYSSLSDVNLEQEAEQLITFRTKDQEQDLDRVAREVLDGGYGLQELALRSKKLEDVFFQLTR
ncbi:MAG: ABC transporter ATP-binding protein [Oligoflexus sp.]